MASRGFISGEGRRAFFSILPPFVYAILLMAIPLAAVVIISFQVRDAAGGEWLPATVPGFVSGSLRFLALALTLTLPVAMAISIRRESFAAALRSLLVLLPLWLTALYIAYSWLVTQGIGLGNYAAVFTDPINIRGAVRGGDWQIPLLRTLFLAAVAALAIMVAGHYARWPGRMQAALCVLVLLGLLAWFLVVDVVGGGIWLPGLLPRSLFVSIAVTAATVILAYPIAYFISFKVAPSRKSLWLFLITIPFWTSYLIRIFLWKVILGYSGVVNAALTGIGIIDEPLTFILYNANAVIITLAHAYAPFAILPIFVALEKIDRSLKEASRDLGENRFTTFLRVTLPLSVPGIVAAVLIVFIPTIGDYVTPELVGGSQGLLIANRIQALFLQVNDPGLGSALSIVTMATVGVTSLIFVFALRRWLRRA